jgi:hypothetical protein
MSRFHPKPPRTAIGLAAIALSAVTLGLAVVAPAALDTRSEDGRVLTAARAMPHVDAAVPRLRIEVVGLRAPEVAATKDRGGIGSGVPRGAT